MDLSWNSVINTNICFRSKIIMRKNRGEIEKKIQILSILFLWNRSTLLFSYKYNTINVLIPNGA